MSKEVRQKHDQEPQSQLMAELKAKNAEMDGLLLVSFGWGKAESLILRTPATLEMEDGERKLSVADFLVVTRSYGNKVVHIDNFNESEEGITARDFSEGIILRLGKKERFSLHRNGHVDGELRLSNIYVTPNSLLLFKAHPLGFLYEPKAFDNWRLMDASTSQVEKILDLNKVGSIPQ